MKIERVEVFGVAVPLIGEYKNAYRSKSIQKSAVVRITASGGEIGLGNIDPSPGYSRETIEDTLRVLETRLAPLAIGMDPTNVHAVLAKIEPAIPGFFDAKAAIEMACVDLSARMVAPFKLQRFEQPVPADDIAGMARVRREANAVGVPIMADESVLDHASLIRIIRMDAADIVKVKVMKQGGFLNTRRMIATAEAAGIRCVVGHGFGLGINTMAEIMLAATSENVIDGLECVGPLKTADDIVTHKIDLSSGRIPLPAGPGLGVTLDEEKLATYRLEVKAAAELRQM